MDDYLKKRLHHTSLKAHLYVLCGKFYCIKALNPFGNAATTSLDHLRHQPPTQQHKTKTNIYRRLLVLAGAKSESRLSMAASKASSRPARGVTSRGGLGLEHLIRTLLVLWTPPAGPRIQQQQLGHCKMVSQQRQYIISDADESTPPTQQTTRRINKSCSLCVYVCTAMMIVVIVIRWRY